VVTPPVPAATLILVRDGRRGLEVLLGRRSDRAAFGGVHVFPGGLVEELDHRSDVPAVGGSEPDRPFQVAAVRETAEEVGLFVVDGPVPPGAMGTAGAELFAALAATGIRFDLDRLSFVSNWVTPEAAPRRFDTRFFVARGDDLPPPVALTGELADPVWVRPGDALGRAETEEWRIVLPTRKHLEMLEGFSDAETAIAGLASTASRTRTIPRVVRTGSEVRAVLPGDPGYEEAE